MDYKLHDAVVDCFIDAELPIAATYTQGEGEYESDIDIVGVEGGLRCSCNRA